MRRQIGAWRPATQTTYKHMATNELPTCETTLQSGARSILARPFRETTASRTLSSSRTLLRWTSSSHRQPFVVVFQEGGVARSARYLVLGVSPLPNAARMLRRKIDALKENSVGIVTYYTRSAEWPTSVESQGVDGTTVEDIVHTCAACIDGCYTLEQNSRILTACRYA